MKSKITLITPPDIYENANKSILLCHMTDEEQDSVSKWLRHADLPYDLNLYTYTNEANAVWFLYALNRCEYKYINIDNVNLITSALAGYVLSRNNVYFKTTDTNLAAIYSHINTNRIDSIDEFLERILGAKTIES
jgi:hypothetical protein